MHCIDSIFYVRLLGFCYPYSPHIDITRLLRVQASARAKSHRYSFMLPELGVRPFLTGQV